LFNGAEADWSPDGKKIAFVNIDENQFRNLYLLDLETKTVKSLTDFNPKYFGHVYHPSFSPWGDQICFALAARDKNSGSEIFAVNVDGSGFIRLIASRKTERYPGWAKDDYPDWGK
jgi:Tol biopolymer transport system component